MSRTLTVTLNKFDRDLELVEGEIIFSDGKKFKWSSHINDLKLDIPIDCTPDEVIEVQRQIKVILQDYASGLAPKNNSQDFNEQALVEALQGLHELEMIKFIDKEEKKIQKEIRGLRRKAAVDEIKERTVKTAKATANVAEEIATETVRSLLFVGIIFAIGFIIVMIAYFFFGPGEEPNTEKVSITEFNKTRKASQKKIKVDNFIELERPDKASPSPNILDGPAFSGEALGDPFEPKWTEEREWTDEKGQKILATLLYVKKHSVGNKSKYHCVFRKWTGEEYEHPVLKLSKPDRIFIKELMEKKGAP